MFEAWDTSNTEKIIAARKDAFSIRWPTDLKRKSELLTKFRKNLDNLNTSRNSDFDVNNPSKIEQFFLLFWKNEWEIGYIVKRKTLANSNKSSILKNRYCTSNMYMLLYRFYLNKQKKSAQTPNYLYCSYKIHTVGHLMHSICLPFLHFLSFRANVFTRISPPGKGLCVENLQININIENK